MASYFAYGTGLKMLGRDDIIGSMQAGVIAGSAFSVVTTPFEMVKVNAQKAHRSTFESFRAVVRQQGVKGLYKGIGACLVVLPAHHEGLHSMRFRGMSMAAMTVVRSTHCGLIQA